MLRAVLVYAILFTGLVRASTAQDSETSSDLVIVPSTWKVGDEYTLKIVKEQERLQWSDGAWVPAKTPPTSRSTYAVRISEENDQGPVYSWTCKEASVDGAPDPITTALAEMAVGQELIMQGDELGSVVSLINSEETMEFMGQAMEVLFADLEEKGTPPIVIAQLRKALGATFANDAAVAMNALKEPQLYYFMCGAEIDPAQPTMLEYLLPNVFGGDPLPSNGSLSVVSVDPIKETAILRFDQAIDGEKSKDFLENVLGNILANFEMPEDDTAREEFMASMKLDLADRADYNASFDNGVIHQVDHVRVLQTGPSKRVDRLMIQRSDG